ncbi:opioid growth factor receptor conserved region-domain-containing protein [Xylariaceae sp. FL0662B]|nr:opioid growth factor receptor conserved region-domain-containing protein [Xylariaceae sp. FL0662B]
MASSSAAAPRPTQPALRRLVDFYDPGTRGPDARGRTLDQILRWRDTRLEIQHDYIQTLFPLPEGSIFNDLAPIIDEETFLYFRQHDELKGNLRRAFTRILAFYGFEIKPRRDADADAARVTVVAKDGYEGSFARWVRRMDHNHLRITRILRCLRVLGLELEARGFYDALLWTQDTTRQIGARSMDFWERAIEEPLHIAPDGTEVEWLEKYETEEASISA